MKLYITGVWRDGTDYAPEVPQNTATVLSIPISSSCTVQLEVLRPDGTVPDLTLYTATWTVRKHSAQYGRLPGFVRTATPVGAPGPKNRFEFALTPGATRALLPGRFVHDVWIVATATGERNQVVPLSALVLTPSLSLS